MQCSYCGTLLPAGAPFCPHCGKPTTNYTPQQRTYHASNQATPTMDFGPLHETSAILPDVAQPSSPVQPQQPLPNQQPHMIFGPASQQGYSQPDVPPQQQQYPQYPQQPATTFGSEQGPVQRYP